MLVGMMNSNGIGKFCVMMKAVDFFLQEAGNILADLIHFSSNKMEKSTSSELALKNGPTAQKP